MEVSVVNTLFDNFNVTFEVWRHFISDKYFVSLLSINVIRGSVAL